MSKNTRIDEDNIVNSIIGSGSEFKGEFKIKTVEHLNHQGILENINVIRWEVCCDEPQNSKIGIADSKICLHITE